MRIWDLAEMLVRMNGLRPGVDIEIVETALRPGEKLHEELWWDTENMTASSHPRITLGTVDAGDCHVATLIPLIRELVDRDEELHLRGILEDAVGLNGDGHAGTGAPGGHPRRFPGREHSSGETRRRSSSRARSMRQSSSRSGWRRVLKRSFDLAAA